jgi:hypothetical protein
MIDAKYTPAVFIRTLGVFEVIRDGTPVPRAVWQSTKARDLLKILIARRKATSRDQLIDLLWPEIDRVKGGNRLSVLLGRCVTCYNLTPARVPWPAMALRYGWIAARPTSMSTSSSPTPLPLLPPTGVDDRTPQSG